MSRDTDTHSDAHADDALTFRGRSVEELLPKIREALGPDAVVMRRRDGLVGGVGGFFQRPFVELEARAGTPGIDTYDDSDGIEPNYEPPAQGNYGDRGAHVDPYAHELEPSSHDFEPLDSGFPADDFDFPPRDRTPAPDALDPVSTAHGQHDDVFARFSAELGQAERRFSNGVEPSRELAQREPVAESHELVEPVAPRRVEMEQAAPAPVPAADDAAERRRKRRVVEAAETVAELADAGLEGRLAGEVGSDTVSHLLPFAGAKRTRGLVRQVLASKIPTATGVQAGRAVAFVGPAGAGKTACAAQLAEAYAAGSDMHVVCIAFRTDAEPLAAALAPHGVTVFAASNAAEAKAAIGTAAPGALVVIDTPAIPSGDAEAIKALGNQLKRIGKVDVHLALPATVSAGAAQELRTRLAPLRPAYLALTHADETAHLGPAITTAIKAQTPIGFVARRGPDGGVRVTPADAAELAGVVLP